MLRLTFNENNKKLLNYSAVCYHSNIAGSMHALKSEVSHNVTNDPDRL